MTDTRSDPHANLNQVKRIAAAIFARHGVDFATARRAGGWSNATWLAGGLALRIATRPGNETIRREARLAVLLPAEVGYPALLETGLNNGYEWALSKEVPGQCLGEVWNGLDWDARAEALRGLWARAEAVHSVPVEKAAGLARTRAWFNSNDAAEAEAGLERLTRRKLVSPAQVTVLRNALDRFWQALPGAARVLNHGDLTLDNAIWHEGQVVSLLDFEFALVAPVALDCNSLIEHAFQPGNDAEPPPGAGQYGSWLLRKVVADLVQPIMAQPINRILVPGYAILLNLWRLELWLAHPEGEDPLIENWEPYRRLVSFADGKGGYLAPLLGTGE